MSFGIGTVRDIGYGEPASGAPMNGVDLVAHADVGPAKWHSSLSVDSYIVAVLLLALAGLWLLGGVAFRRINII